LDDGLDSGLLSEEQLNQQVRLWRQAALTVEREYGKLPDETRRYFIIRCITDLQVKDVVQTTEARIQAAEVASADEVRLQPKPLVQYSGERRKLNRELRDFLYKNLYYSWVVNQPHIRARQVLEELFLFFMEHHTALGRQARKRARRDGWPRAICDYLAGMTDRYAMLEHERVIGNQ
jgi:dGTPase